MHIYKHTQIGYVVLVLLGTGAAVLVLKNGKRLQVGTDDADELCKAMSTAIATQRHA